MQPKSRDLPDWPRSHMPSAEEIAVEPPRQYARMVQRYLWVGMTGQWALPFDKAKACKKARIDTVPTSLRVVVQIMYGEPKE